MYLKTERLVLQPIAPEDLPALVELLTDETVKQTYLVPDFPDEAAALAMAARIAQLSRDPQRYVAGIYLQGQLIGLLNETEVSGSTIELGYALLPRYHNRGYCTEALRSAIADLFARQFAQVRAGAFEENPASIRVMEKSGMTRIEYSDQIDYRGKIHRCVYYAIGRSL